MRLGYLYGTATIPYTAVGGFRADRKPITVLYIPGNLTTEEQYLSPSYFYEVGVTVVTFASPGYGDSGHSGRRSLVDQEEPMPVSLTDGEIGFLFALALTRLGLTRDQNIVFVRRSAGAHVALETQ